MTLLWIRLGSLTCLSSVAVVVAVHSVAVVVVPVDI